MEKQACYSGPLHGEAEEQRGSGGWAGQADRDFGCLLWGARTPDSGLTLLLLPSEGGGASELLPGQGLIDPSRSLEPVPSSVPQAAACFLVSDCKQI